MATLVLSLIRLISVLFIFLFSSTTLARHHTRHTSTGTSSTSSSISSPIRQSCAATRYPSTCESQLTKLPSNPTTPPEIILSALNVSAQHLKTAESMVQSILSASSSNLNRSRAAALCLNFLSYSARRSSAAAQALLSSSVKDARTWAGAALVYQYDCWSGLKYVNGTAAVNSTMSFFDTTLIVSTSNALSMMLALDAFGNDTASWSPPRTERDGFWLPHLPASASGSGFGGPGFWEGLYIRANVTVCKGEGGDHQCDYETVQAAVDAADRAGGGKGRRFVVRIREGVYKETVRVGIDNTNLVFLGDGIGKTVITASLNAGMTGVTTYATATVGVLGDRFMAYNLTIENTAGPDTHQAVAFTSDSDLSYIENCEFLGNQDTLYAHSLRQLYRSCRIEGNVDFIFGNSAAVFHNCTILIRHRQRPDKGETNAATAHGRTDPAQPTGFSFLGCVVNGTEDYVKAYYSKPAVHKNYLGRPWKTYSRTVFIGSTLGEIVHPAGWLPWTGDFALSTLYYGEYGNQGPGAALDKRVPWSSQIPAEHVGAYSIENFLQGDEFSMPNKQS